MYRTLKCVFSILFSKILLTDKNKPISLGYFMTFIWAKQIWVRQINLD